jgi:hypothetical protein
LRWSRANAANNRFGIRTDNQDNATNNGPLQPKWKIIAALSTSIAADIFDYLMAPIFTIPLIGDIPDSFFVATLYLITKSKLSAAINLAELLPVVGDLSPTYTLSTLLWLYRQRRAMQQTGFDDKKRIGV